MNAPLTASDPFFVVSALAWMTMFKLSLTTLKPIGPALEFSRFADFVNVLVLDESNFNDSTLKA